MNLDEIGSICAKCAKKHRGKWPEGHQATSWIGRCSVCGEETDCCDVGDYDWPDGKRRGMRD